MRHQLCMAGAVFLLFIATQAAAADAVVISKDVPHDQLSASHLRNALLGRITTWSDGRPIVIVLSRSPGSEDLLHTFIGRDLDHLVRGWKRLVFTGNGSLPEVAADDQLTIRLVANTPGAVALIASPHSVNLPAGVQSAAIDVHQGISKPDSATPKTPTP